ncbi:MAG: helix-turn-helix transcriptional regulator [bacterium]|nr:helix-turn-helix transcriptional regulator [bacterium]
MKSVNSNRNTDEESRQLALQSLWENFIFDDPEVAASGSSTLLELMDLPEIPTVVTALSIDDYEKRDGSAREAAIRNLGAVVEEVMAGYPHFFHAAQRNHAYINAVLKNDLQIQHQAEAIAQKVIVLSRERHSLPLTAAIDILSSPAGPFEWHCQACRALVALRQKLFLGSGRVYYCCEDVGKYQSADSVAVLEQRLRRAVAGGLPVDARLCMQALTEAIVADSIGYLFYIRVRLQELAVILSRTAMESGMPVRSAYILLAGVSSKLFRIYDICALADLMKNAAEDTAKGVAEGRGRKKPLQQLLEGLSAEELAEITLERLAESTNQSYTYLSKRFHRELGMTFSDCANRERLDRALKLMHSSDLNLTEIALASGFSGQHHFIRVFKKEFGKSPRAYRAEQ